LIALDGVLQEGFLGWGRKGELCTWIIQSKADMSICFAVG
jgi:hypothetical protein